MRVSPAKLGRASAAFALACACLAVPAGAAENDPPPVPKPERQNQPLSDGCQRNPAGLLTYTSPEWVYVYSHGEHGSQPTRPRVAAGVSLDSDVGAGDLPEGHHFYDFNTDLKLDPAYDYLAPIGDENLHLEWESGTPPTWSWTAAGDRMKVWGHWIWDCGHWGQGFQADPSKPNESINNDTDYFLPGTGQTGSVSGESTEFHPLSGMISTRLTPFVPEVGETQTDAYISTEGTPANADSRCAYDNPAPSNLGFYGPDWTGCVNNPASEHQPINDRDYDFFIPAPPKPTPEAGLRFRSVSHDSPGQRPDELFAPTKDGIFVSVPFQGFGSADAQQAFGKSLFVGWSGATQFVPAHVQVLFKTLTIHHSLDDPNGFDTSAGVPPGEWNMYSDINGVWKLLNDYVPGLATVTSGQSFELNHTYDLNVPDGEPLRVHMDTRECDLPKIQPCPATSEVAEDNDNPGVASDHYASVGEAVGNHVLKPSGSDPDWELSYEVKLISPAGKRRITQGAGCFDVFPPKTRVIRRKARAGRRHISLRGKASERDCSSRHARPKGVEVSVARKSGKRCRFLGSNGKLGPRERCRLRRYLPAKGRKHWRFRSRWPGRPGTYLISARASDGAGNIELPGKSNSFRLRLKR